MRYLYPVKLVREENRVYIASCRDVPEAVTEGSTPESAVSAMSDALGAALAGYSLEKRDIPIPTKTQKNEHYFKNFKICANSYVGHRFSGL